MLLKYHYSKDYGHIFIGFVTFTKEIELGKMKQKFDCNNVMFMLCGPEDGRIFDISESCNEKLGLNVKFISSNEVIFDKSFLSILDFCPSLESAMIDDQSSSDCMYETYFDLNLNMISQVQSYLQISNENNFVGA